jgi:putative ABC transport system substrate-binding protein
MKRRTLLLAAAALVPVRCLSHSKGKAARIAVVLNGTRASESTRAAAFTRGMRDLGYVEGRDFVLDLRHAGGRLDQLPGLIGDALRAGPDVLVTGGSQGAWAAKKATSSVPVVIATVGDPVGQGLVESLARPGGNMTGFAILSEFVLAKAIELLRELAPQAQSVGYLVNSWPTPLIPILLKQFEDTAKTLGLKPLRFDATNTEELARALDSIVAQRPSGIVVAQNALFHAHRQKIAEFTLLNRIVAVHPSSDAVASGGLASYAADLVDPYRRAATLVDRILRGAKPGDLPFEQSTRLELHVNLKTARALGITIPPSVLARADRVIE